MKTLNRILLITLVLALIISTYAMHASMTGTPFFHDAFYHPKYLWLVRVHEITLYAVLIWCLLFVRRQPLFVRIGLAAVLFAFVIAALPPKVMREIPMPAKLR